MTLPAYLRHVSPEVRAAVAAHAETSVQYLYKLAGNHGVPSKAMAQRIEDATRAHVEQAGGVIVTAIAVMFPDRETAA